MSDRNIHHFFLALTGVVLAWSLLGCELLLGSDNLVQRISDGDTLTATDPGGNKIKVRFACIDAPEVPHSARERKSRRVADLSQFKWGERAQKRVEKLVEQSGDRVTLTITDTDRYGRKVAEVRLSDGTLVQEVLVREGLALVYRPYLKNCPSADAIEQAEAEAKRRRRGVWSDSKFIEPWDYRKR
ncbi:MAG: thermonuclease family protein [Cyanobacteriota bacterium]|nr:thermonuclease family protein [Cyanobacteriota bacterium]